MIYFGNWSERLERRLLLSVVVVLSAAPQSETVARRSFVIQFWQLIEETIVSGVNTDADWSGGTRQRAVTQTTSQEKDKN